jgi:homoserine dehydrogenase
MKRLCVGLIGYGTVGQGVVKILKSSRAVFRKKYGCDFHVKTIVDRIIHKKPTAELNARYSKRPADVLGDPDIDIVVELIGGKQPAKSIVESALASGKDVVTANKDLIANHGIELFALANRTGRHLYYESAVGAGIPIIKTISEGIAGNGFDAVYGIVNGTCNFILDEMTTKQCSFADALKDAQRKGYAESDPTLDVNGVDSAHKIAILANLAFGKLVRVRDVHTEGITHISATDIAFAEQMDLRIKLLAIAKKDGRSLDVRVHPTLISTRHSLASIHGIFNAVYLKADKLGNAMLSGEGAGQMSAASGVVSDLINCANAPAGPINANNPEQVKGLTLRGIDNIECKFYIRVQAKDEPGTLAQITTILGRAGIGINSVQQAVHEVAAFVPVILLTDYTTERTLRRALNAIQALSNIKGKPVAIRMETLW